MNVKTGEVLAMANAPTLRLVRAAGDQEARGNSAVTSPYEPGSVEKVLTSAALIDSGVAAPRRRGSRSRTG